MPTVRLDLAYDGSGFRGYALQEGLRTIQGDLESALQTVLGTPVETAVAGRTDAGVHARGQVVSVHVGDEVDLERLSRSLNGIVGPEIAVKSITLVDDGFHARFSANWRRYRYSMSIGNAPDPLARAFEWHVGSDLDLGAMEATAAEFFGEHDFSAFCRSVEGRSNVRLVDESRWDAEADRLHFWIRANAFCHQMVRSLVGLCYDVGRGFTSAGAVRDIIESGDRSRVVTVAPPHGLTLWEVGYQGMGGLPGQGEDALLPPTHSGNPELGPTPEESLPDRCQTPDHGVERRDRRCVPDLRTWWSPAGAPFREGH